MIGNTSLKLELLMFRHPCAVRVVQRVLGDFLQAIEYILHNKFLLRSQRGNARFKFKPIDNYGGANGHGNCSVFAIHDQLVHSLFDRETSPPCLNHDWFAAL